MTQELSYYERCFLEMKEMFNLPDEIFFELNDAFFDIAFQQIELLRTALLQKDMEQLILHSHTLKGSSLSLRHLSISRIAAEIEHHAKEKTFFAYATAIYTLSEEITKIRSQYMNWKSHQSDQ
ncbi:MAG: Hpt domain-containing protein [Sulfuricurvum sp.]|jgi:HPt (histidine-containing phosphotransfer) domain-containing protein